MGAGVLEGVSSLDIRAVRRGGLHQPRISALRCCAGQRRPTRKELDRNDESEDSLQSL